MKFPEISSVPMTPSDALLDLLSGEIEERERPGGC